jgi:hypothetical protein
MELYCVIGQVVYKSDGAKELPVFTSGDHLSWHSEDIKALFSVQYLFKPRLSFKIKGFQAWTKLCSLLNSFLGSIIISSFTIWAKKKLLSVICELHSHLLLD